MAQKGLGWVASQLFCKQWSSGYWVMSNIPRDGFNMGLFFHFLSLRLCIVVNLP